MTETNASAANAREDWPSSNMCSELHDSAILGCVQVGLVSKCCCLFRHCLYVEGMCIVLVLASWCVLQVIE